MQTIAFDGIAYGMVLFVLAIGFCMTIGLMNFINLAHAGFGAAGGALTVVLAAASMFRFSGVCQSPSSSARCLARSFRQRSTGGFTIADRSTRFCSHSG